MLLIQLSFNSFLFFLGLFGIILNRRHFLIVLICIELILLSLNLSFLLVALHFDDMFGMLYSFFMLTIAASESAVGLAIIISYYKNKGDISVTNINSLKS